MADDAPTAAGKVVDEARSAADGTRQTARWIASAFAGIPTIGVLAALVRAPGDKGFDPLPLFAGIALSAAGAVLGIFAFGRVLAPVPLAEKDLKDALDLTGIPGHPFKTYGPLAKELKTLRTVLGPKLVESADAVAEADRAKAIAAEMEAQAAAAEKAASEASASPATKRRAFALRDAANAKKLTAAELTAVASFRDASAVTIRHQIEAREQIRGEAMRLLAADAVTESFRKTRDAVMTAAALVVLGVFFLAIAPRTEAQQAAATLVTLSLNPTGQDVLGCEVDTLQAIRIGGDDETPEVITLPTDDCPSQVVKFHTSDPARLGSWAKAELVTPPPASD